MGIENTQEQINTADLSGVRREQSAVEKKYEKTLVGESFEDAADALEGMEALQSFREKLRGVPFGTFHEAIEEATNIGRAGFAKEEKENRVEDLARAMEEKIGHMSPRVADLYAGMIAEIKGEPYEPHYEITAKKIAELKEKGDLTVLFSPRASWGMKLNRIETRLTGYLLGARALDRREGEDVDDDIRKWREKEIKKMPKTLGEDTDESEPGVDPMDRKKEGEPTPAIWRIEKAYDGYCKYFREKAFSEWDATRNKWVGAYQYSDAETTPLSGNEDGKKGHIDLVKSATVQIDRADRESDSIERAVGILEYNTDFVAERSSREQAHTVPNGLRVRLPIPYTHGLNKVEVVGHTCKAEQNQDGDISLFVEGEGEVEVKVFLAPHPDKKFTSDPQTVKVPEMPAEFSEETDNKLEEIRNSKRGNIKRALAMASYVRGRVKYLAPKDKAESERYNSAYRTHTKGFAGAVDEIKEGDCDVVNTYFSALCAKLNIPTRHVVGHSVDEDADGNLITHFGTGHAWSEVWDEVKKEWVMIDATPPGDRNLEEPEDGKKEKHHPGSFGEQEAIGPTDEELEELRKKLAERKEELSYTKEERELSEHAGVELKEARQIVKEINEAENTRLPNGERVVDVLTRLFNAIVESRKAMEFGYAGPVRASEGGEEIEDIISHYIQSKSGDMDPRSRSLSTEEIKEEKTIGGFDLYVIGDKSGSMRGTVEGEVLWKMQRRAEYLIFSALHSFERDLERAGLQKENALSVRTQGISFRGSGEDDIDLDKPLSPQFSAKDKVAMWHSLTGASGGNGDPEALGVVYEQIKEEIKENERRGGADVRLRMVIACSDGGYIGDDDVRMQNLAEELGRLNAVVVGMGLTETAASVKEVMTTEHSRGDIARDINDLPALVAKHLVSEAIKLFPEKAKEDAKQVIESSLDKFKRLS